MARQTIGGWLCVDREKKIQELEIEIRILDDKKESIACLDKVKEMQALLKPDNIKEWKFTYLIKGYCYYYLRDWVEAEKWFNEANKYVYDDASKNSVLWAFTLIYQEIKEYDTADQCYEMLGDYYINEQLYKEAGQILFNRGNLQCDIKNYEKAIYYYDLAKQYYRIELSVLEELPDSEEKLKKLEKLEKLNNHLYEHWADLYITEIRERNELNEVSRTNALNIIHKISDTKMRKALMIKLLKGGE